MTDPFRAFCETVGKQFRSVRDAEAVTAELLDHLLDHRDALEAHGLDREAAMAQAVDAMGDPVALGKALDRLHSPWPWRVIHVCTTGMALALAVAALFWVSWLFRDDYERPAPFFPTVTAQEAEAELVPQRCQVFASGPVSGGGRVGDYILEPMGQARSFYDPERPAAERQGQFMVSASHPQPWLGGLDAPWYGLSAVDDLGNTYTYESVWMYRVSGGGRVQGWQEFVLYPVDPEARRFTVTLEADRGRVQFTASLSEEGAP